jgi:serine/threonine-protein kinase
MFKSPKEDPSDIVSESVGISLFAIPKVELDQFMNGVMNNLKMKNPDLSVIESTPTKLAGKDAHKVVYYLRGKKHMTIITRKENKAYQVMYAAEPTKYDTYLPIVQKMLDSFKIIR